MFQKRLSASYSDNCVILWWAQTLPLAIPPSLFLSIQKGSKKILVLRLGFGFLTLCVDHVSHCPSWQILIANKTIKQMNSLWSKFFVNLGNFSSISPSQHNLSDNHSYSGLEKNLNSSSFSFGHASSSHILFTQGHFLLIVVNDFVRRWLPWTLVHWASEL